jgi:hypothetical protein
MLPTELLFNIYFYIDDYILLSQFPTLNKGLYQMMKRYSHLTQTHRMNVLKKHLFKFLDVLVTQCDDDFVDCPSPDLTRMYILYKSAITNHLATLLPLRYFLLASDDIANMVMISGQENVDKIMHMAVSVGRNYISVHLIPLQSNEPRITQKQVIFDVLRNSKYKFVQLNYKYISRIFDSVMYR